MVNKWDNHIDNNIFDIIKKLGLIYYPPYKITANDKIFISNLTKIDKLNGEYYIDILFEKPMTINSLEILDNYNNLIYQWQPLINVDIGHKGIFVFDEQFLHPF